MRTADEIARTYSTSLTPGYFDGMKRHARLAKIHNESHPAVWVEAFAALLAMHDELRERDRVDEALIEYCVGLNSRGDYYTLADSERLAREYRGMAEQAAQNRMLWLAHALAFERIATTQSAGDGMGD